MQDKEGHIITCCNCESKENKDDTPRDNFTEPCKSCDSRYSKWKFKNWENQAESGESK